MSRKPAPKLWSAIWRPPRPVMSQCCCPGPPRWYSRPVPVQAVALLARTPSTGAPPCCWPTPPSGPGCAGSCRSPRWAPASRRGPAPMRSGLPTSRQRPPPRTTCAPGTWTGPSCAPAASPMPLPPAGSGSHPRRYPAARSPAPTSLRSLLPCSTIRVPGIRRLNWSAETPRSPRPCTASPDLGSETAWVLSWLLNLSPGPAESNKISHTWLMARVQPPWAPPLVELSVGVTGHLLCWEKVEADGSWWAWVSWVHESGRRMHHKVVQVRADTLRPLEPPGAYKDVPRRVRGLNGQIRD